MELQNKLARAFTKLGYQMRKNSPQIFVFGGIAGVVVSAVLACRATLKANEVLIETRDDLEETRHRAEHGESAEAARKELTAVYARTGLRVAALYLPSVGLGALSIAGILTAHNILCKRNAALAAAYSAIDACFREYRARVADKQGEEAERDIRLNAHEEKIEEIVLDEEGNAQTVERTVTVVDVDTTSGYARYFDRATSEAWLEDDSYNQFYLRSQQNLANNLLFANGYLFLNDVYTMLGIQRSIPGQVVGWVYDKERAVGDNYIDFGAREVVRRDEYGELETVILLDFNVDGNIWERAAKKSLVTT